MTNISYSQFCALAMAAEILCTRWTPLVLRELHCGSTRFNDLRAWPAWTRMCLSMRWVVCVLANPLRIWP